MEDKTTQKLKDKANESKSDGKITKQGNHDILSIIMSYITISNPNSIFAEPKIEESVQIEDKIDGKKKNEDFNYQKFTGDNTNNDNGLKINEVTNAKDNKDKEKTPSLNL